MQLYIESLGCARNQVDSENMAGQLREAGWSLTRDPADAAVIVVNTCSFVESAINESIDTILELAERFVGEKYRRYPVLDGGRLVGVISRRDVMRAMGHHYPA